MTPRIESEAMRVSQAAREAAARAMERQGRWEMADLIRAGERDTGNTPQAFAHFEAQAQAELVEALRKIAAPTDFSSCIGDPWDFYRDLQAIASKALARIEGREA
jgi:O-succinylbenzoate synthase